MKWFLLFLSICSISIQAQIEDCIIVQGVVKNSITKEILPNSRVYVYDANRLMDVINIDKTGSYKLIYSPEVFKQISIQVKCLDIEVGINGKQRKKFFASAKIRLADIYLGKAYIFQDVELERNIGKSGTIGHPFFDLNSAQLNGTTKLYLNQMTEMLNNNPKLTIQIIGHAMESEPKKIGLERAENSFEYLVSKGVDKKKMITAYQVHGKGLCIEHFRYPPYFPLDSIANVQDFSKRVVEFKILSDNGVLPDSIVKDILVPNSKFVFGKVLDMVTKEIIENGQVIISGSDGSLNEMNIKENGQYFFEVKKGVLYQIQGSSNETISKYELIEVLKYFASKKALLQVSGHQQSFQQNIEVEAICNYGTGIPEITFSENQAYLLDESKLKLNGLISTLIDNPILNLEFNYSFNSFEKNENQL